MAIGIFGTGVWLVIYQFLWSAIIRGKVLAVAGLLIAVGGYWLWMDFVGPALGIKTEE